MMDEQQYSDLPPGAKVLHDPAAASTSAQYSDLPPGATILHAPAPGKGLWQTYKDNFNAGTQGAKPGDGPIKSFVENVGAGGGDFIRAAAHPIRTVEGILNAPDPALLGLGMAVGDERSKQQAQELPKVGVARTIGQLGVGTIAGEAFGAAASKVIPIVSRAVSKVAPFSGSLDTVIPGTDTTPRLRYESANRVGVQLDAADATGSPTLGVVKKVNENSLTSSPTYESNKTANLSAVRNYANDLVENLSQHDREMGGAMIRQDLIKAQMGLHEDATSGFQSLPQNLELPGLEDVGNSAKDLAKKNAAYQDLFPSLTPNKAMSVIGDVSGLASKEAPVRMSSFVDESGKPIPSSSQAVPTAKSFALGQKLRSDLLEFRRKNPDIVAGQGDAMVGQLAGQVDNAIMDGAKGLPPEMQEVFRNANAKWKDMAQTFDSPTSPYYSAVREQGAGGVDATTLAKGFGPKTPNFVRDLSARVSPETMDVIRRGVLEDALGTAPGGGYHFGSFPRKWNALPNDYVNELFGPMQAAKIQDLADTTHALNRDYNPSGTARTQQKIGEAAAIGGGVLNPPALAAEAGYHGAQFVTSKAMNSPGVVDWLLKDRTPTAKGPDAWANAGAVKMVQHGLSTAAVLNLGATSEGRRLLVKASDLTPGSKAMESIAQRVDDAGGAQ